MNDDGDGDGDDDRRWGWGWGWGSPSGHVSDSQSPMRAFLDSRVQVVGVGAWQVWRRCHSATPIPGTEQCGTDAAPQEWDQVLPAERQQMLPHSMSLQQFREQAHRVADFVADYYRDLQLHPDRFPCLILLPPLPPPLCPVSQRVHVSVCGLNCMKQHSSSPVGFADSPHSSSAQPNARSSQGSCENCCLTMLLKWASPLRSSCRTCSSTL